MDANKNMAQSSSRSVSMSLPVGTILHGEHDYCIEEVLGQGGFGFTYLVSATIYSNNIPVQTQFAIKEHFVRGHCMRDASDKVTVVYAEVARDEVTESREDFIHEAKRLVEICKANRSSGTELSVSNHHIVPVNECFEANGTAYFVMEYLGGGSLRSLVRQHGALSEAMALSYMRPIIDAVEFLHTQHRLLHMDIKPENIVMRNALGGVPEVPMLIDFGISLHFKSDGSLTTRSNPGFATPGYSPLEQSVAVIEFDPRFDIYGLGATLFYLLTGHDPLPAADMDEDYINAELPDTVSSRTRAAIIHALRPLKRDRTATAKDLLLELEADYTLPIGYMLDSKRARYRVTRIIDDHGSYIEYEAHLIPSDTARQGGAVETTFSLLEFFVKDHHQRRDDFSVSGKGQVNDAGFVAAIQEATAIEDTPLPVDKVQYDEYGEILFDLFEQGGTRYCALLAGFKPKSKIVSVIANVGTTTRRGVGRVWQLLRDNALMLGVALCTCAVIAAAVVFAPKVLQALDSMSDSKPAPVEQEAPKVEPTPSVETTPEVKTAEPTPQPEVAKPEPVPTPQPEAAKPEQPKPDTKQAAKPEPKPSTKEEKPKAEPKPATKPEPKPATKAEQPKNEPKSQSTSANVDQMTLQLLNQLNSAGTPPSMADMNRLNSLAAKASPEVKAKVKAFNKKWDY